MTLHILTHPDMLKHDMGNFHPEQPARLRRIIDMLQDEFDDCPFHDTIPPIDKDTVLAIHDAEYVDTLLDPNHAFPVSIDGDTVLTEHTANAALTAAGCAVKGVNLIASGETNTAFCAIRPPGHHAEYNRAMGFCFINTAYLSADYAIKKGFKNVVIVDWDVHHGNGTDNLVRHHNPEHIFYTSMHQSPLFPGTGVLENESAHHHILNIPVVAETTPAQYKDIFTNELIPWVENIQPDLIIISAGFDAHADDPLAGLGLREFDFEWMTKELLKISPKILSILEGGYNLDALELCVSAHCDALRN